MDVIGRSYVLITSGSSGVDIDNKNCILNSFNPTTKKKLCKSKRRREEISCSDWNPSCKMEVHVKKEKVFYTQKKKFTKRKVSAWTTLSHLHF